MLNSSCLLFSSPGDVCGFRQPGALARSSHTGNAGHVYARALPVCPVLPARLARHGDEQWTLGKRRLVSTKLMVYHWDPVSWLKISARFFGRESRATFEFCRNTCRRRRRRGVKNTLSLETHQFIKPLHHAASTRTQRKLVWVIVGCAVDRDFISIKGVFTS